MLSETQTDCEFKYFFTCRAFTCQVNTDARGIIVWAAPIVRKFLGQPIGNLLRWQKDSIAVRLK